MPDWVLIKINLLERRNILEIILKINKYIGYEQWLTCI